MITLYHENIATRAASEAGHSSDYLHRMYGVFGKHVKDQLVATGDCQLGELGYMSVVGFDRPLLSFSANKAVLNGQKISPRMVPNATIRSVADACSMLTDTARYFVTVLLNVIARGLKEHHRIEIPSVTFVRWLPPTPNAATGKLMVDPMYSFLRELNNQPLVPAVA